MATPQHQPPPPPPPPVADRRSPERRSYQRRAEDRARFLAMAAQAATMVCLGIAVLFAFFAVIGTINFGQAAAATIIAAAAAVLWFLGFRWRRQHMDRRSFQQERERRGF